MRTRVQFIFYAALSVLALVILRLSYWQIIKHDELSALASGQYSAKEIEGASRGQILTADGYPLVLNQAVYTLGAYLPGVHDSQGDIVDKIMPHLRLSIDDPDIATDSARLEQALTDLTQSTRSTISERLGKSGYEVLAKGLSVEEKDAIAGEGITGLVFDQSFIRAYPEASMAAHLTGFVGRDQLSNPTGYFGLEGYYDRELAGRSSIRRQDQDASGNPLLSGDFQLSPGRPGRSLRLHLERGTQYLVESELKDGLERYGAQSGEVIIMDPQTGGILAMASFPSYDQQKFHVYDPRLYKNPSVANAYEPGSTFKVLVMASAFNEGVISEDDHCDICASAYPIGKYTIKTWNSEYHPDSTPQDIIVHSDNVGMVWVEHKLGDDKFLQYLKRYGFGEKTGIDLQEEVASPLRTKWGDIDYATASFGQGIAVTSIQMVRAVAAIANGGKLMEPHVVASVLGEGEQTIAPKVLTSVITPDAAERTTRLMVAAVEHGESQWAAPKGYKIAGKTGTAQVAVEGHYDAQQTITSFVGFAPAYHPRFVMLVKLTNPKTSQWGSETAAPLWFAIAKKLLLHYNIPPNQDS